MSVKKTPANEEIPGVTTAPTRRQVKGFKRWLNLTSREHAESKPNDNNDAAKAAADAVAHMFNRQKFGN